MQWPCGASWTPRPNPRTRSNQSYPHPPGSANPLYPPDAAEPQSAWTSRFWRRGLAFLADGGILAAEAGNPSGEAASVALLQRLCPQDVWASYLKIPERALQSARASVTPGSAIDDHARIAIYTAAGYLYAQDDRPHCDTLYRKAITCYLRLLNTFNDWSGNRSNAALPNGQMRTVGTEYYLYRNRVELLGKYCGDWWGTRVVRGEVTLQSALDACNYKMFRALVRLRADKGSNAAQIAAQEYLRRTLWNRWPTGSKSSPVSPRPPGRKTAPPSSDNWPVNRTTSRMSFGKSAKSPA